MAEKVARLGVKRERGFLYFIGKDGDVWRVGMHVGTHKGVPKHRVAYSKHVKDSRFMYFLDKDGDVARSLLNRKGRSKA